MWDVKGFCNDKEDGQKQWQNAQTYSCWQPLLLTSQVLRRVVFACACVLSPGPVGSHQQAATSSSASSSSAPAQGSSTSKSADGVSSEGLL